MQYDLYIPLINLFFSRLFAAGKTFLNSDYTLFVSGLSGVRVVLLPLLHLSHVYLNCALHPDGAQDPADLRNTTQLAQEQQLNSCRSYSQQQQSRRNDSAICGEERNYGILGIDRRRAANRRRMLYATRLSFDVGHVANHGEENNSRWRECSQ